jgi:hypothetical protein
MSVAHLNQPPPSYRQLQDQFAKTLFQHGHENVELEFRVGYTTSTSFVPGINKRSYDAILNTLRASPTMYHEENIVTTELIPLKSGFGGTDKYVVEEGKWLHKKRVTNVELGATGGPESPYCIRGSISLEVWDEMPSDQPSPESIHQARHKNRSRFRHRCWAIDLTTVVDTAEKDSDSAKYELEVELLDTSILFCYDLEYMMLWGGKMVHAMLQIL